MRLTRWRALPALSPVFFFRLVTVPVSSWVRLAPRWCISAPPVRAIYGSALVAATPFFRNFAFFSISLFSPQNLGVGAMNGTISWVSEQEDFVVEFRKGDSLGVIHRLGQGICRDLVWDGGESP